MFFRFAENKHMAERLALRAGDKGFAAAAGRELFDVIGSEALQELSTVSANDVDDRAAGQRRKSDAGDKGFVLGQKFRGWLHRVSFSLVSDARPPDEQQSGAQTSWLGPNVPRARRLAFSLIRSSTSSRIIRTKRGCVPTVP